jgi:hypothetical protein
MTIATDADVAAAQARYAEIQRALADIDVVANAKKAPLLAEAKSLLDILSTVDERARLAAIRRYQAASQANAQALARARLGLPPLSGQ